MHPVVYAPLQSTDHIRLITIVADENDQLSCEMTQVKLDEKNPVKYSALSYTWGSAHGKTVPLRCDEDSELQITGNLAVALLVLAKDHNPGMIWIDQICIDQKDDSDKGHSVGMMNVIYERAHTIYAWLGQEREDTALAVDWIKRVGALAAGHRDGVFRWDSGNNDELRKQVETREYITSERSEELGIPFDNTEAWTAFSAFYDKEWYQRIWVVQEMLPAREALVICGRHFVDWHLVKAAAAWYSWKAAHIKEVYDPTRSVNGIALTCSMNITWSSRFGSEYFADACGQKLRPVYRYRILTLLNSFRERLSSEPKDKIYALLGISDLAVEAGWSKSEFIGWLRPDYSKTDMEVFRGITMAIIQRMYPMDGPLNVLISALPRSKESGWPTWVPDWRITENPDVPVRFTWSESEGDWHQPAGSNKYRYIAAPDDNSLMTEGTILGKAKFVSEFHHGPELLFDGNIRATWDICHKLLPQYPTGEDVKTAFAMALMGGVLPDSITSAGTTPEKYGNSFMEFVETVEIKPIDEEARTRRYEAIAPFLELGFNSDWFDRFRVKYCERRFFITDTGYMGIGDYHMKEGDAVAVLWGLDVACILHPLSEDPKDGFEFVGEAYCRGAAEAVKALPQDPEGITECQEILLR